jgi:YjjG family noncanonical pyrimidine nucleotidase
MKFDWLLFDADNTLFDYDRAEPAALESAFQTCGLTYDPSCLAAYREINDALWQRFEQKQVSAQYITENRFGLFFEKLGLPGNPAAFNQAYLEAIGSQTVEIDGAREMLETVSRGHRLALISNGLARVQRKRLSLSRLGKFFPVVIISEEAGASKPDPKIFDAAFAQMGNPPKEKVLMIGDSLSADVAGALGYGLPACWFNPGHTDPGPDLRPTYVIHSLRDLPAIL